MRVEKVSVCWATVALRRYDRRAAKHHLIDHELAVIFAHRTFAFFKTRIGQIGRVCPFPALAPIEFRACRFPFKLGRQSHTFPLGKRRRLVKRNVTNWRFPRDLTQTTESKVLPYAISLVPIKWRRDVVLFHPIPAFGVPQAMIGVAAGVNKCEKLGVGDEAVRN